jgi:hypothetical protein
VPVRDGAHKSRGGSVLIGYCKRFVPVRIGTGRRPSKELAVRCPNGNASVIFKLGLIVLGPTLLRCLNHSLGPVKYKKTVRS